MATTSSNLTAGKAITEQGGNGKGYKGRAAGLVATAALGLSLLTGGLLGYERQAVTPRADQSGATAPHVYVALGDRDDPRFASASTFVPDQFTYREVQRAVRPAGASTSTDYRWDFGPGQPVAPPVDASTSTEYRWDFPAVNPAGFVPDQFTYREDHRASSNPLVTSFLPGKSGRKVYA
jgi:hypothetical protein